MQVAAQRAQLASTGAEYICVSKLPKTLGDGRDCEKMKREKG